MAHRPDQMSEADRQFLADPAAFLQSNIVIVRSPIGAKRNGPNYWKLIPTQTGDFVTSTGEVAHRKNRHGRIIPCYNLRQSDDGGIQAMYVHWEENNVVPGVLPSGADDADFFITATMNGCSFSFAQNSAATPAYVAHHNDKQGSGRTEVIEGQAAAAGAGYFHQAAYRKVRDGAVDGHYFATLIGKRGADRIWRFYCASRKNIGSSVWSHKGVQMINP